MADVDLEESAITLKPHDYVQALKEAFSVLQEAHPIIVAAVEKGGVAFLDIECYLRALDVLQTTCGCDDVQSSSFLDELNSWISRAE
jgi:hypothetical protein